MKTRCDPRLQKLIKKHVPLLFKAFFIEILGSMLEDNKLKQWRIKTKFGKAFTITIKGDKNVNSRAKSL